MVVTAKELQLVKRITIKSKILGALRTKLSRGSRSKRALSPIFATVLLAAIVILFGSVAFYFSNNLTTTATNNYVSTLSSSQQTISERIGFENLVYSKNPLSLTIYIVNSGSQNSLQIGSVFVYNSANQIVGYNSTVSPLRSIDGNALIANNWLNVGQEGYFSAILTSTTGTINSLPSGSYTVQVITTRESTFDYQFVIQ